MANSKQKYNSKGILSYNEETRKMMMSNKTNYLNEFEKVYGSPITLRGIVNNINDIANSLYSISDNFLNSSIAADSSMYTINSKNPDSFFNKIAIQVGGDFDLSGTIENLLSISDIKYALQKEEIGINRYINVYGALSGAVTTNINNFSGTDTPLGLFANRYYAQSLYSGALFNSSKSRDKYDTFGYITPSLYNQYSNNMSTVYKLGDMWTIDQTIGRTHNEYNVQVGRGKNWNDFDDVNITFLKEQIKNAEKENKDNISLLEDKRYLDIDIKENGISTDLKEFDIDNDGVVFTDFEKSKITKKLKDITSIKTPNGGRKDLRVWSKEKQYKTFKDGIKTQTKSGALGHFRINDNSGESYLTGNTVIDRTTGLVNITPYWNGDIKRNIKKTMFSIENLAWKDVPKPVNNKNISKEQTGPFGGRIMWFPPYDLQFSENVSVNWSDNTFIGRGEKVYTYSNTDRTGTLQFTMLIDHPSIINLQYDDPTNNDSGDTEENSELKGYFAGIDTITNKKTYNNKKYNERKKEILDKDILQAGNGEPKTISFKIYFPYNYSGYYWDENGLNEDNDWLDYLMYGINQEINNSIYDGRGYEISNLGITEKTCETDINELDIFTRNRKEIGGIYEFEYRTDAKSYAEFPDLRKWFECHNHYDENSFQLNRKLPFYGNISGITEDTDAMTNTFSDFFIANKVLENSQNGIEWDKSEVYELSNGYHWMPQDMYDLFTDDEKERVTKLYNILKILKTQPTFYDVECELKASYCSDAKNKDDYKTPYVETQSTAKKRLMSFRNFIKDMYPKWDIINGDLIFEEQKNNDINSKDAKLRRYLECTIHYKFSKTNEEIDDFIERTYKDETDNLVNEYEGRTRYETEAEFFQRITENDEFGELDNIKQKIKNFNPAFHSITPEGFNARLNFLHQCTRQGSTLSPRTANGDSSNFAGNLAFGRMPVCVLRLGDFFYSKVLITGMGIEYSNSSGMQWDMNTDGIGLQPMFAKINLSITIIGGQSLEGPINRLQNAETFDYYANTGVYDDRADKVKIENGKTIYSEIWVPENDDK